MHIPFFFTEVMGLTMNLINGTHHFYERKEYVFNALPKYDIILPKLQTIKIRRHLMGLGLN